MLSISTKLILIGIVFGQVNIWLESPIAKLGPFVFCLANVAMVLFVLAGLAARRNENKDCSAREF